MTAWVLLHREHDGIEYNGELNEVVEGRRDSYNPEEAVGERIETGTHKSSSEVADFLFVIENVPKGVRFVLTLQQLLRHFLLG